MNCLLQTASFLVNTLCEAVKRGVRPVNQEGKTESLMASGHSGQSGSFPEVPGVESMWPRMEWARVSLGCYGLVSA